MDEDAELHVLPQAGLQTHTCFECGASMTLRVVSRQRHLETVYDYRGSCGNCKTVYVGTIRPELVREV